MAEGIVTFIGGYKGLDKITKIPDYTSRLAKAGKTITLGALTDFVAFGEDTGRLTDIIHQYNPDIEDTWLGYLVSKEDENAKLTSSINLKLLPLLLENILSAFTFNA